ncbi:programmed cell death protein 2-like [Cotesia glomerata]|uniref:programmed cell death protein 2-like n=1 Tax=Cotesia glomerata TaxID=32391 RepID=UPI001D013E8F|nr:programmed cell death protein 2-like [Cotesia glomerata]
MEKLKKMMAEKKAGYLQDVEDKQLEEAAKEDDDEAFTEFKERIKRRPAQVLRYQRGGDPLLVSKENKPQKIPPCENCNSRRTFEFQIMPQLLNKLNCSNENSIDWGVLLVTLVKSPVSSLGTSGSLFGSKIMLTSKIKILARKVNIDKMVGNFYY